MICIGSFYHSQKSHHTAVNVSLCKNHTFRISGCAAGIEDYERFIEIFFDAGKGLFARAFV